MEQNQQPAEPTVNDFVEHISIWHANVVGRLNTILQIPEDEAIEIQDKDLNTVRTIIEPAEKNLFISGVMCALTMFSTLPIEVVEEDNVDEPIDEDH